MTSKRIYILSPHFDDAAYGLTITISKFIKANIPVTLINCFTITGWTALPVTDKDVKSVSLLRATEDQEYNKLFNSVINIRNLDLLDAPLRNGYIFQSSSFAPNEWALVDELKMYISEHVNGILFCPLSIGDHIDHAICKEAVSQVYKNVDVVFYEDLPYADRISEEQLLQYIHNTEQRLGVKLSSYVNSIEDSTIDKRLGIAVYKSQLNDDIRDEIIGRMNKIGGERIWAEPRVINTLAASHTNS